MKPSQFTGEMDIGTAGKDGCHAYIPLLPELKEAMAALSSGK